MNDIEYMYIKMWWKVDYKSSIYAYDNDLLHLCTHISGGDELMTQSQAVTVKTSVILSILSQLRWR